VQISFGRGEIKKRTSNIERSTSNVEVEKMKKQTYDLEERLLEYSVRIIKIVEQLPNNRVGNHVAGQLLKSGTSPYPNHGEAQAAESPRDFIHKLRIALKELRETERWLKLIQRVPLITKPEMLNDILQETEELIKIFVTSIKTAEKKHKK
jgi:four helix bundle protein